MNTLILFGNDGIYEEKKKKLQNWRVYKKNMRVQRM